MKITEHRKRKTGATYWILEAESASERDWCLNISLTEHELAQAKYDTSGGMRFVCRSPELKDMAVTHFTAVPEVSTKDEERDDDMMSVNELRKQAAEKVKANIIISPRASMEGSELLAIGESWEDVEEAVIWKGLPPEQVQKIRANA